jgi:antitoxin component YwqK of YwqJK toxin-antitoxin module
VVIGLLITGGYLTIDYLRYQREYYNTGILKAKVKIKNEKMHGLSYEYYPDGKLWRVINWENGRKEGFGFEYYKNGEIKTEVHYEDDIQTGEVSEYDSLGNLIKLSYLENGETEGTAFTFYPNSDTLLIANYSSGTPNGWSYQYFQNGALNKVYYYERGNLVYYKAITEDGRLYDSVLPITIRSKTGESIFKDSEKKEIQIILELSRFDSLGIGVIFGQLSQDNHLLDSTEIISVYGNTLDYEIKDFRLGQNELTGMLFEINEENGRTMGGYYFRYNFEVTQ